MKQSYFALLLIIVSAFISSCHEASSKPLVISEEVPVTVIKIEQQTAHSHIQASGQFTTEDETFLSFKTGGIINQIFVKEGDPVHKGQLLATVHLTEINAQVQQATFAYEKALRDHKRYSNLYRDSVGTLEQVQNTKTALDIAQQQLRTIHFNQIYSEIRALSNGYVLKKMASEGQMVNPGDPVLQINGANQSKWLLKVAVSDKEWSAITIGNKANIQTDALPGQMLEALVVRKSKGVDPSTGTFIVDIELNNNKEEALAAGLFGRATIYTTGLVPAWSLPYEAVIDGEGEEAYVFITRDGRTAQKIKVRVQNIDHGAVTISQGLEGAKSVIIAGSAYLKDGAAIKITN